MMALAQRFQSLVTPLQRLLAPLQRGGRFFLPVVFLAYAVGLASYALIWAVDPFDMRAGGVAVRLTDKPLLDRFTPRVIDLVAKSDADLVLVGGSTMMAITPQMLAEAFPEAKRPYNLAFVGPTRADFALILEHLSQSRTLKRLILTLDFTMARDMAWLEGSRTKRFYNRGWHDPVPEYQLETVLDAFAALRHGALAGRRWERPDPDRPEFMRYANRVTERPKDVDKLQASAVAGRDWVFARPLLGCAELPALSQDILPQVRALAARGVAVEIVVPPFSLAVYTDWTANFVEGKFFSGKGAVWANLVGLRRCTVEQMDGVPGVTVHAFDTDLSITADLSRYLDSSHLYDLATYREIMMRVARRASPLTKANWETYEAGLKKAILAFPR